MTFVEAKKKKTANWKSQIVKRGILTESRKEQQKPIRIELIMYGKFSTAVRFDRKRDI